MKTQTKQKSRFRGFYTALFPEPADDRCRLCLCVPPDQSDTGAEPQFPERTDGTDRSRIETEPYEAPVVGVQTDVAKPAETTAPPAATTAPATETAATAAETVPETAPPEETPVHQLTPPLADFAILNPFSDGELIKSETTGTWQTHNGVDLSCAAGADVFAIDTGTVSKVCSDALWGYTVTIDHDNGVTSRYCGLDGSLEVREGDTVQTGQKNRCDRCQSGLGECPGTAPASGSAEKRRVCRSHGIFRLITAHKKRDDVSTVPYILFRLLCMLFRQIPVGVKAMEIRSRSLGHLCQGH